VSWKYLDLFDLFDANQQLRDVITRLLGDGGDDYAMMNGSTKDLATVLNLLKRTSIRASSSGCTCTLVPSDFIAMHRATIPACVGNSPS
jgi:hypothetical protein